VEISAIYVLSDASSWSAPPGRRSGKLEQHYNRGYLLGYTATFAMIYYWDLDTKRVTTAYSVKFDEVGIAESSLSPNSRRLHDALDNRENTDKPTEVQAPAYLDLLRPSPSAVHARHLAFSSTIAPPAIAPLSLAWMHRSLALRSVAGNVIMRGLMWWSLMAMSSSTR
jgi:hypothetical protein